MQVGSFLGGLSLKGLLETQVRIGQPVGLAVHV